MQTMQYIRFISYQNNGGLAKIRAHARLALHHIKTILKFYACRRYIQSAPRPFRLSLSTKGWSHNQSEQDVKDFFEESSVIHQRDTSVYKIKIEAIWWSFHIEHITNPMPSVKKKVEQEDEAIIMSKRKSLNLVRTKGSDRRLPINR
jgi:hypothetical protein